MIFVIGFILDYYDLSQIAFNLNYLPLIMLLIIMGSYVIYILYFLITIIIRMNKIRRCIETKDVNSLIRLALKSSFNLLRYVKMAAISGLGDIGSNEANSILHNLSMDQMIEIQSRATTSLDMISVKNDQEKRYYLKFI